MADAERKLYLLPVWLGEHGGPDLLPAANTAVAGGLTLYFAEHEKTARHMLRRMLPSIDLPSLTIHRLDERTTEQELNDLIHELRQRDGAIMSEAGMPAVADPGARLVARAHAAGIRVVPLAGPSSILQALAASGLNGQRFTFHGYLPREAGARKVMLRKLEQDSLRNGAAQLFIETPYRNKAMFTDLLASCSPNLLLCVAEAIGQPNERIRTLSVAQWRGVKDAVGEDPAIFLLGPGM